MNSLPTKVNDLKFIMPQVDLEEAQRVLQLESLAITRLSESLDDTFLQALHSIQSLKGRLITTGMGKSGHIARKIAATLASTGTASFFIHPGEASHGDLGMLLPEDGILAFSNSGETRELADIISYSRRRGIPIIAITQKKTSSLAQDADIALILPAIKEACPNNLAPTTSTIMMLALGDAIAITLLKLKGFLKEDYKMIHPGGSLGNRLRRVKDLMHKNLELPLINHSYIMQQALLIMTEKRFGCVGVINDEGKLIGIITDGDLRRHMAPNLLEKQVTDIMTKSPKTINAMVLVEEALHIMQSKNTNLFVVDHDHKPIGLVHIHDILKIVE